MMFLDEKTEVRNTRKTIVGFNKSQIDHKNVISTDHPESTSRIALIEEKLIESGLLDQCEVVTSFLDIDNQDLELTHDREMVEKLSQTETLDQTEINMFCNNYDSVFMTSKSFGAAKQAIGCVRELTHKIMKNDAANGFAIVRPPGHHADQKEPCGFCIFNNVAQAAEEAFNSGADRILIVDLDVHHGNGTQRIFYDDKRVLYFSIHRYEFGKYWPHLREGNFDHIGEGAGVGYNANLPLNETGCGDSDYLAILFNVLLPLATQFDPHFVIVSAGFDSCLGDPLGEMKLSPIAYSHFVYHLKSLAKGRLLLVLEGGYNHQVCAIGVQKCLKILLGYSPEILKPLEPVKESTIQSCLGLLSVLRNYWTCFEYYPKRSTMRLENWPVINISAEFKFDPKEKPADTENIDQQTLSNLSLENQNFSRETNETLIFYNEGDSRHYDIEETDHPEKPERTEKILGKIRMLDKCVFRNCDRLASDDEILLVHTQEMLDDLKTTKTMTNSELDEKMEKMDSIFLTNDTLDVALTSVGTLLQSVDEVYQKPAGQRNSFVIIRPPGHHASSSKSSGFCIFNNVAVAARYAQKHHGAKKVMILDWDVHHGNGTQEIFYEDNSVLYISIHRHDKGAFYPIGEPKDSLDVGENSGIGYSVNIPFNGVSMGDFEYQTSFNKIIMPIAYEFNPDLVLISAGFDAATNDPLGEFEVSPETYALMTYQLLSLASGRVITVLEGGYNLTAISNSALAVTEVLLHRSMVRRIIEEKEHFASESKKLKPDAIRSLREVATVQQKHWKFLSGFQVHMDPANNAPQSSNLNPDDFAGHTVVPLRDCPHLVQVAALPENGVDAFKTCNECNIAAEVWTCLTCYQSHCGRFVNEHAIHHYETSSHPMALSLADLSAWCYPCEAYVHNPILTPAKSSAHESKFGNPIDH